STMTPAPRSVILIAGCSAGFDSRLSHITLDRGFRVISTARRVETRASRIKARTSFSSMSLLLPVQFLPSLLRHEKSNLLHSGSGQIEFLLNNTGYLQGGTIEENTPEEVVVQLDTNVFGFAQHHQRVSAVLPHAAGRHDREHQLLDQYLADMERFGPWSMGTDFD
ncbi:hypothetical protein B0H14DRAFT_2333213, partial [Mycena olivaceomarginata]